MSENAQLEQEVKSIRELCEEFKLILTNFGNIMVGLDERLNNLESGKEDKVNNEVK